MNRSHRHQEDDRASRVLIGYAEYLDLPDWNVYGVKAKVDTGARSSSLHVENIQPLPGNRIRFEVVVDPARPERHIQVEAPIRRHSHVRSSSGHGGHRYFVSTRMVLGSVVKEIEISLASRGPLRYRMLLGRTALRGDFIIDAGRRYAAGKKPRRRRPKTAKPTSPKPEARRRGE